VRGPSWAWAVAAVAIAALVAVPSLAVLASLANPAHEIWAHLWRTQLPELIGNTLALVAGVGAGTLVVGAGLAWLIVTYRFPGRAVLEWALILPLAVPAYVIGFALLGLFDFSGPVQGALRRWIGPGVRLPEFRSYWGVVLTMTLVFYPYVYLLARAAFREQGAATLETARSLGRSRMRAFAAVTLPLARPSLVAGVSLAMMEALADLAPSPRSDTGRSPRPSIVSGTACSIEPRRPRLRASCCSSPSASSPSSGRSAAERASPRTSAVVPA
jgi:iron(III) transport system permease protein